jgi:hypothetical protein
MKMMSKAIAIAAVLAATSGGTAYAQGQNGRGLGKQQVSVAYYKVPPGKQDEWLALYKKYHKPIMQYQIDQGYTTSSTLYTAGNHSPGQPWDFAIISISPPENERPKLALTRPQLIKKLFPDLEDYVRGERARWALTLDHWDDKLVELDIYQEPLSLYYPLDPSEAPAQTARKK